MTIGLLGTAAGGLLSMERAIGVTGHNISNANTDGYSRQRVDFGTQLPTFTGAGYVGNGTKIEGIDRQYDQFLTANLRSSTSSSKQYDTYAQYSARVGNLLGDANAGLGAGIGSFFNAVQDVANDPTSIAARQVMVSEGEALASRFQSINSQLESIADNVNGTLVSRVGEINTLSASIANVNKRVVDAVAVGGGAPPNDLLDKRDAMITRLSELVDVRTVSQDDGSVNVFIGSGQALVAGNLSSPLEAYPNPYDARRMEIAIKTGDLSSTITASLHGGEVGALLDFRDQVLDPAQSQLGRIAVTLGQEVNAQHQLGVDLDGNAGKAFFSLGSPLTASDPNNAGSATVTVSYDTPTLDQLSGSDYTLNYDGTTWRLRRAADGQLVGMSGAGTSASPFNVEGLNIVVSGSAAGGDSFRIMPTRDAANAITLQVTDARDVAAAARVIFSETTDANGLPTNSGDAAFHLQSVSGASGLAGPINILYDAAAQTFNYSGAASGSFSYDPATDSGGTFSIGGVSFKVTGDPANGDGFDLTDNAGGTGDNTNALALASLQSAKTMVGGTASFDDAYSQLVGDVGTRTRGAQITAEAQQALQRQAQDAVDAQSGVNLDEEAANLMRYQQAYQALAQLITVADQNFQTLLSSVGR